MFTLPSVLRRRWRPSARPTPPADPRRFAPCVEALEARAVPATIRVVPAGQANGTTQFATLAAALAAPGLAAGDVIQIQPGSAPGDVASNPTAVNNLTIQGDPLSAAADIPEFTVSGTFTVGAGQTGFSLRRVNARTTGAGEFTFLSSTSILDTRITADGTDVSPVTLTGAANTLAGSTLVANNAAITSLVLVNPGVASANVFAGNTFVATALAGFQDLLRFAPTTSITTTDVVANNAFVGNGIATDYVMVDIIAGAGITLSGYTVRDNVFTNGGSGLTFAISTGGSVQNTVIRGNVALLAGGNSTGATILGNSVAGTAASATIEGNDFLAPGGAGIFVVPGSTATDVVNVKVQGNNVTGSQGGISIGGTADTTGPLAGLDFGGGSQGSLGGNDFRGFTTATGNSGAVVISAGTTGVGTISAQKNLFAPGVAPATVVTTSTAPVDTSNPLTGNAAFAAVLYARTLGRAGDTANPSDAGGVVIALNAGGTRQAAAEGVIRSTEAAGRTVDRLYAVLLGTPPDPAGKPGFVNAIVGGATLEQVVADFVTLPGYAARYPTDDSFVGSLYANLLGRPATAGEVKAGLSVVTGSGRAALARSILGSAEFRTLVVQQMYGFSPAPPVSVPTAFPDYLDRAAAPTAAEVGAFVNSPLDVLALQVRFASDAPTAVPDTLTPVAQDSGPRTIPVASLTANDLRSPSDPAQMLTLTAVGGAVGGAVTLSGGNVLFTPAAGFSGTASFSYTIQGSGGLMPTSTGTVSFTVTAVMPPPPAMSPPPPAMSPPPAVVPAAPVVLSGPGAVTVFNPATGQRTTITAPFGSIPANVAVGDVTGDGVADFAFVPGAGGGPVLNIVNGATGQTVANLLALPSADFRGGLSVAVGTGAGNRPVVAVGAGNTGGPYVRLFDAGTMREVAAFFAFDPNQRTGVNIALGDVTGDGVDDIIVGSGAGPEAQVKVIDGTKLGQVGPDGMVLASALVGGTGFLPLPGFTGGVFVAAGNLDGDGKDDIVVTPIGGGVYFTYAGKDVAGGNFATRTTRPGLPGVSFAGGLSVTVADVNGDRRDDVLTTPGAGGGPALYGFDGVTGNLLLGTFVGDPNDRTGRTVG